MKSPGAPALPVPRRQPIVPARAVSAGWYRDQRVRSEHVTANASQRVADDPAEAAMLASAFQAAQTADRLSEGVGYGFAAVELRRQLGIILDQLHGLTSYDRRENREHTESYAISRRMTAAFGEEAAA